ncbi:MAG: carbonic anhydrase [Dongiaceae bacterium]
MSHHHAGAHSCCAAPRGPMNRRRFMSLTAVAAAGGLTLASMPQPAVAAGKAKALLLSCMDYRLIDDLVRFMDKQGLQDQYDHVILAGASLGVVSIAFTDWHETFWQHLDVAIDLHHIETVIVVDHRDCGAYRIALSVDTAGDPEIELDQHRATMIEFAKQLEERHPTLGLETYLMALDGSVEQVELG